MDLQYRPWERVYVVSFLINLYFYCKKELNEAEKIDLNLRLIGFKGATAWDANVQKNNAKSFNVKTYSQVFL